MKKALIAMSGGVDSSLAAKPDSQDICFVPDWDYAGVIERHTGRRPVCGNFVDMSGNVLGQHKGVIHYRHPEQWATVMPVGSDAVHIVFDEPQRAITPGQAAVLYDGDTVLGGGVIQKNQNHA